MTLRLLVILVLLILYDKNTNHKLSHIFEDFFKCFELWPELIRVPQTRFLIHLKEKKSNCRKGGELTSWLIVYVGETLT
jgi:hypothetical protein